MSGRADDVRELAVYTEQLQRSASVLRRRLYESGWHFAGMQAERVELDLRDLREMLEAVEETEA